MVIPRDNNSNGYENYLEIASQVLNKLQGRIDNSHSGRLVVQFSIEARNHWISTYNHIESNLQVNGRFQYAKDHGAKLAENIARIAALLTYIEHGEGKEIPLGILLDAENIAFHFSDTFLRCLEVLPDYIINILDLKDYFQTVREDGVRYIRKNKVRQSGPSRLRIKSALDDAIASLGQDGDISTVVCKSGMIVIDLYPSVYFDQLQWDDFCFKNKVIR
jgi:hypothetical protein